MVQRKRFLSSLLLLFELLWAILYTVPVLMKKLLMPRQSKDLRGKKVLITGAGQGIGRGLAMEFVRRGCKVLCIDENTQAWEKTIQQLGNNAQGFTCDISKPESVADLVTRTGPVDILINNTVVITYGPLLEADQELINRTIDINVKAHFWLLRMYLPGMLKKNEGHVVVISSVAGLAAPAYMTLYGATRFALVGLMESLKEELRIKGSKIKLTCVCPYFVRILSAFDTCLKSSAVMLCGLGATDADSTGDNVGKLVINVRVIPPMETADAVQEILNGILEERFLFTVPWYFDMCVCVLRLFPKEVQNRFRDAFYVKLEGSATNVN